MLYSDRLIYGSQVYLFADMEKVNSEKSRKQYLGFYLSAQHLKCGFFMGLNKNSPGTCRWEILFP